MSKIHFINLVFMRISHLIILLTAVFYTSCTPSSKKEEVRLIPRVGKFNKIELGKCDTISGGVSLKVNVWEPVVTDSLYSEMHAFLNKKIIDRINDNADLSGNPPKPGSDKTVESAFAIFDSNYKKFKADFPEAPGCWEIELKGDTVMTSAKIIQYQFDHYAFLGGAHPNSFRSYYIFDTKTGEEKNIKSFISDTTALLNKVEKAFRKLENLADTTNLEGAGYFLSNHKFFLPANFALTKEGIFFYYNPYEIAAYARGDISFTIPYSELEGIVRKELIF